VIRHDKNAISREKCHWSPFSSFGDKTCGWTGRYNLEWTAALPQDQANDLDLGRPADLFSWGPWTWHIAAEAWSWRSASSSATRRCAAPSAFSRLPRSSSHPSAWHRVKRRRLGSLGGVTGSRILPTLWNDTWHATLGRSPVINSVLSRLLLWFVTFWLVFLWRFRYCEFWYI
jgi:hypothetical protein